MSEDELSAAIDLLRTEMEFRRGKAFKKMKVSMKKGDTVSFINNDGERVLGEVKKVKTKKALVIVGNVQWDVPIGMLSAAR
tara:strand:+ start:2172 stop:2414 length:243 start_codon:yes stop_codon:yes gene_type:complete